MTIQTGTRLQRYINANYRENTVDAQRAMLRAFDFFTSVKVISTTITELPSSPSNGDAYLILTGAVSPAEDNTIYVWRTGVTSGITNEPVTPFWEAYPLSTTIDTVTYTLSGLLIYSIETELTEYLNESLQLVTFTNPFNQDLNNTDNVTFNSLSLTTPYNPFDQSLNTTDNVHFGTVESGFVKGISIEGEDLSCSGGIFARGIIESTNEIIGTKIVANIRFGDELLALNGSQNNFNISEKDLKRFQGFELGCTGELAIGANGQRVVQVDGEGVFKTSDGCTAVVFYEPTEINNSLYAQSLSLGTIYNPFDQLLNTTDDVTFASLSLGTIYNPFDQSLNTTDNVHFGTVESGFLKGISIEGEDLSCSGGIFARGIIESTNEIIGTKIVANIRFGDELLALNGSQNNFNISEKDLKRFQGFELGCTGELAIGANGQRVVQVDGEGVFKTSDGCTAVVFYEPTTINGSLSADSLSLVTPYNPFNQDLNITDDASFNSLSLTIPYNPFDQSLNEADSVAFDSLTLSSPYNPFDQDLNASSSPTFNVLTLTTPYNAFDQALNTIDAVEFQSLTLSTPYNAFDQDLNTTNDVTFGTITGALSGNASTATTASACSGNSATVTTNANLTGDVTSVGNASTVKKLNGVTLSSLATGLLKNTTTTGAPSIAVNSDLPAMSATVGGAVPTPPNDASKVLSGAGTWISAGGGNPFNQNLNTGNAVTFNTVTASVFTGSLSGNASTATSATTASTCSGNAATATTASACSGNADTATSASACTGNSTTATVASTCSGNAATATTASACSGNSATATVASTCSGNSATVTTNANLTGDVTSVGNASTVKKLNGVTLSSLATGLLKNTTTTGAPSIAVNSDLPAMSATVGGAVPTPPNDASKVLSGAGTWVNNAAIPNLTGDVTSVGSATTVVKLNGTSLAGLSTGILKNTTSTGVPSIAVGNDLPVMTATTRGAVPTPPNDATKVLAGNATWLDLTALVNPFDQDLNTTNDVTFNTVDATDTGVSGGYGIKNQSANYARLTSLTLGKGGSPFISLDTLDESYQLLIGSSNHDWRWNSTGTLTGSTTQVIDFPDATSITAGSAIFQADSVVANALTLNGINIVQQASPAATSAAIIAALVAAGIFI